MEQKLYQQLQASSHEQLVFLLEELSLHYPFLELDIATFLQNNSAPSEKAFAQKGPAKVKLLETLSQTLITLGPDLDVEEEEDLTGGWDFSGNEPNTYHPLVQQSQPIPLDTIGYINRVAVYGQRLRQGEAPQIIIGDLTTILEEAARRGETRDYRGALLLYGIIIDERLRPHPEELYIILDEAIHIITPTLETLLNEAGSEEELIDLNLAISPVFTSEERRAWIERIFYLWLVRLSRKIPDEELPLLLSNMLWTEDLPLIRELVQRELQKVTIEQHGNIINFALQYKEKMLDRFLKEIPELR